AGAVRLARVPLAFPHGVPVAGLLPWVEAAPHSPIAQRLKAQLRSPDREETAALLQDAMRAASSERQAAMADVLAGRREGAAALVSLVQQGHASGRLLNPPAVLQKLAAVTDARLQETIKQIISDLPPASDEAARLIRRHRTSFDLTAASSQRGQEVFK